MKPVPGLTVRFAAVSLKIAPPIADELLVNAASVAVAVPRFSIAPPIAPAELPVKLVPALTMRAFAEERRNDTLELLLTAPVGEVWIVLAKFLSVFALVLGMYLGALAYAFILEAHGVPDWGPIASGYLAIVCQAALIVSIGLLMSSLTENQVVAAALTLGAALMLWFADSVAYLLPPPFDVLALNLSLIGHFRPMVTGSVFVSDICYFVSLSLLALFLTTRRLAER